MKRSASDSEQAFMPFTLAYLKASDALTPGNRFYSDHPSVSDYQLKEFTEALVWYIQTRWLKRAIELLCEL